MGDISVERTPRRTPRKISENVRELHTALTKVLNNEERTFLIQSLNQYQREKNVNSLVLTLKSVLNTPKKREVYPLLWQIIPHNDQEIFHHLWHGGFEAPRQRTNSKSPARSPKNLRRIPTSSSLPDNLNRHASDSGIDLPNMTQFHSSHDAKYPVKRLTLKRHANSGFGFCIRGGAEHGVGLYVSSVDESSVSEKEGLLPGDHIIQVNGTKFDGLTHAQAVKIIQRSKKLNLIVRSVGRVPNSFVAESTCKWVDMRGRRASPPPGVDSNGRILTADGIHKSDLRLLGDDDERKVNIFVEDGVKLGLTIRGGAEYGLGIYIAGVDPGCAAEQAGLKAGDQILDVNGQSFLNITHKQAVKVLKSTKNMIVTLKDVGRLPFTRVTYDKTKWIAKSAKNGQIQSVPEVTHITEVEVHSPSGSAQQGQPPLSNRRHTTIGRMGHDTEPSMFHHGIAGSQVLYNGGLPSQKNLIAEQARQVLNENELGTLKYYLEEYSKGYITISAFALALFDLLNTPSKMSLLTEIRSSVAPRDIDRFDDLVLKKEIEIMKSRQFFGSHMDDDRHSIHSYTSSVSSFSGKGSSSRSSAKGSVDGAGSRPVSPPQVPEILPPNVKVDNDLKTDTSRSYEVYEATLTFHDENEETFEDEESVGLPSFLTIDPMSLDLPATENTSVPPPVGVSSPLSISSPMSQQNGHLSPARTVGEATTSLPVGDNTRREKQGKGSAPSINANIKTDESTVAGHGTRYTNGEVSPTGSPTSPQHDNRAYVDLHSKKEPAKPQSPPNPFIFPSTFQGSMTDAENITSISAVFQSSSTKQDSSNGGSPQKPVVTQMELQPKNNSNSQTKRKDGDSAVPHDNDLRPEVAKLPGSKRAASWGAVQDETISSANDATSLANENTTMANANGLPPVKTKPSRDLMTTNGSQQEHSRECPVNGSHTDNVRSSEESESAKSNSAVSQNCNESSSPSESRRSSAASKNRKSWDGVQHLGESEETQKVSRLEIQKDNKERSCSDSNLMNLPKEQRKIIQARNRASQELYELHQQSKTKINTSHRDENLNQQSNTVTLETKGRAEGSGKVNGVAESAFVVEVDKSLGSLGLTLEGGSDMGTDVKIKSVKSIVETNLRWKKSVKNNTIIFNCPPAVEGDFAAWKCGRLKPGQVVLQVDGTSLRGITSGIAVLTLRHAYSNSDTDVLRLLIRDV